MKNNIVGFYTMLHSIENRTAKITAVGTSLTISGAITALMGWLIPTAYSISKSQLLITVFILTSIIFFIAIYQYINPKTFSIPQPRVIKYISSEGYMPKGGFVVTDEGWIGPNLIYAVAIEEDQEFERIIGAVKYVMTQRNGHIQLMLISRSEECGDLWHRLEQGENNQLRDIHIKIGTPSND